MLIVIYILELVWAEFLCLKLFQSCLIEHGDIVQMPDDADALYSKKGFILSLSVAEEFIISKFLQLFFNRAADSLSSSRVFSL